MSGTLERRFHALGRAAMAERGARDVWRLRALKLSTHLAEAFGRICLFLARGPGLFGLGVAALSYALSVEAQLNHSVMHGAYVGLPGVGRFTPTRYETLAIPFRSATWRDAHRLHHQRPSLLSADPDTLHPLFRVHPATRFRFWHRFNTFLGALLTFEIWAFDYDAFLKREGRRARTERGEWLKFSAYLGYHFVLFPVLAGAHWPQVLIGGVLAAIARNLIFTGLQTGSSVGTQVSTRHALGECPPRGDPRARFQVETSKNFVVGFPLRILCGGLDRHIEHHLFPALPPERLHALSAAVRQACQVHGVRYEEHPSFGSTARDSLRHLHALSLDG